MRTALVTGGASGIGAALVTRLRREGFEVRSLDLATGFDVTDPAHWDAVEAVDVACLNAGVLGGPADPTALTVDGYRRAMAVNVDGVVLGVRRLASVMPLGGRIVCTASLAGLTSVPDDPVYAATKHAVVGFVRSVAAGLEARGIAINAICPGFADTPMVAGTARERLEAAGFPLLTRRGRRRGGMGRADVGRDRPRLGRPARPPAGRLPLPDAAGAAPRRRGGRPAASALGVSRRRPSNVVRDPSRRPQSVSETGFERRTARYENAQPSPSRKDFRIRRAAVIRCTSSGPS